jgi:uncharacterized membrane protein
MPDIGVFHPQIVHFVVALGILGVAFRLISLTGRFEWTGPAATTLLILAGLASVAAAQSGEDAHGIAERIPGAAGAVHEHEELGEMVRNLFLLIALFEIAGLALRRWTGYVKWLRVASGVVGLVACFYIYEAGEHGGEIVYSYAGGVGTRSGNPADVERLLVAGLYQQARAKRAAGDSAEAARLTEELARQRPNDLGVQLLLVESTLRDRKDPAQALQALANLSLPPGDDRASLRVGLLRSEAFVAAGQPESARAVLAALAEQFPDSRWVKEAMAQLP